MRLGQLEPQHPAYVAYDDSLDPQVRTVLDVSWPDSARQRFVMACEVTGILKAKLIEWRGRDEEHAEKTFAALLMTDFVVLNQPLAYTLDFPCRFTFRPLVIASFIPFPVGREIA